MVNLAWITIGSLEQELDLKSTWESSARSLRSENEQRKSRTWLEEGMKVFMVAATLRSETMYGVTNLFVNPKLTYGLYPSSSTKGSDSEVLYLVAERAARNLAYQGYLKENDKYECVGKVSGADLLGSTVHPRLSAAKEVYVVPMETIKENNGTAVVICQTADSPDDYVTWLDLRKKPDFYSIDPSWVSVEPIPTLSTPSYGDLTAKALVEKMKINSPKDIKQLAEAKELTYKEVKIKDDLVRGNLCLVYSEPENTVMSRSGDECVVALCDQWFLDYGEAGWLKKAELLLSRMNTYQAETRNGFEGSLGWLRQWACARSHGLGSKLPWDPQFLVESLSDSTIYLAYYTIAHLLHGPPIDGSVVGPLGISHEQVTDEMFEYIFVNGPYPSHSPFPQDKLNILKSEFSYFYPRDIRSSGKDLIPNHLTFCIYVHAALFSEENWPRSMRANGHLMLNGEKMSKSTGNSLTLRDSLVKFDADATRITLADAGDSTEDANFEETTANAAILRLRTLVEWCEDIEKNQGQLRRGEANLLWDKIFENEIDEAIEQSYQAYDKAMYKDALEMGFYQLLSARDLYQVATASEGGMHADLALRFLRVQALLITPIAPHVAEYLWSTVLHESSSVQKALFPTVSSPVDPAIADSATYETAVEIVKGAWDGEKVDDKKCKQELTSKGLIKEKRYMPFIISLQDEILRQATQYFRRTLGTENIQVAAAEFTGQVWGVKRLGDVDGTVELIRILKPGGEWRKWIWFETRFDALDGD
ncbi:hypothetical protein JCM5353_002202 [Sporobolomyces roseus]